MSASSATPPSKPVSVLFVCLGNICRSPMAEGVFQHLTKPPGETHHPRVDRIDSCGTAGYHAGDPPDSRTMSTLSDNGITAYRHEARRFDPDDFRAFDYIFAMDRSNLSDLKRLRTRFVKHEAVAEEELGKLLMWGEFNGRTAKAEEVIDPYYGGKDGFDIVFEQMTRFSKHFLKHLEDA
ncbi:phosphotyrosine protein phosphatase I superfamily [Lineolata rhizophorae]|uniref:Phosphotyrosine protein phosphatase I superfamily n=1 Tax=Lineolata rhizophorae TaxID=578093 RepID=A0A6A6P3R7_9PEZI|nr:phosphotyrosine protein phosphatase I superfamily [Lineolata rhizophorae]